MPSPGRWCQNSINGRPPSRYPRESLGVGKALHTSGDRGCQRGGTAVMVRRTQRGQNGAARERRACPQWEAQIRASSRFTLLSFCSWLPTRVRVHVFTLPLGSELLTPQALLLPRGEANSAGGTPPPRRDLAGLDVYTVSPLRWAAAAATPGRAMPGSAGVRVGRVHGWGASPSVLPAFSESHPFASQSPLPGTPNQQDGSSLPGLSFTCPQRGDDRPTGTPI